MSETDTVSVVVDSVPSDDDAPDVVVVESPSDTTDITAIDVALVERVTRLESRMDAVEQRATEALVVAEVAEENASVATDIAIDAVEEITEVAEVVEAVEESAMEPEPVVVVDEDESAPRSTSHPFFRPSHEWRS